MTSVFFSMISLLSGIIPYYCVYRILDLYISNTLDKDHILQWSVIALISYLVKVICFGISTAISHFVAFNVLEGLRLKVADTFLKAPLGALTTSAESKMADQMINSDDILTCFMNCSNIIEIVIHRL